MSGATPRFSHIPRQEASHGPPKVLIWQGSIIIAREGRRVNYKLSKPTSFQLLWLLLRLTATTEASWPAPQQQSTPHVSTVVKGWWWTKGKRFCCHSSKPAIVERWRVIFSKSTSGTTGHLVTPGSVVGPCQRLTMPTDIRPDENKCYFIYWNSMTRCNWYTEMH